MNISDIGLDRVDKDRYLHILIVASLFPILITIFSLLNNITIVFPHLYYIPIILGAYWYPRRGVQFSAFLGSIYLFLILLLTQFGQEAFIAAFIRVAVFVCVAAVVSYLSYGLEKSELKYKTIFENTGTAIIISDEKGRIMKGNNEINKLSGYSDDEIYEKYITDFAPESEKKEFEDYLTSLKTDPKSAPKTLETRIYHKDGKLRDIYCNTGIIDNTIIFSIQDVTGKKLIEKHFMETKQRLSDIINFLPDATFAIDHDGKVIAWNKAIEELTGIKAEDILGKGDFEYSIPFYGERRPLLIDLVLRSDDELLHEDYPDLHKKDNLLYTEVKLSQFNNIIPVDWGWGIAAPLYDSLGEVVGAIESIRDITEKKQAENALAAEKERLNVTLHSIGDGVIVTDTRGCIQMLNNVAEDLTGWSEDEAKSRPLGEVFHIVNEKTRELCDSPVEKVMETGEVLTIANHTILIARNGRRRIIAESGAPIFSSLGEILGVVLVFRDVTKEKKAEETHLTLATLVNSSDDAIISTTMEGNITSWNSGAKEIYGYTSDEIMGNHISVLAPPNRGNEFMEIIKRIIRGERIEHFETIRMKKNGTGVNVSLTVSHLQDSVGDTIGFSAISRDITRRKEDEIERFRLASIVESSDDAIIGKNLDGSIMSWNAGAERMYGYSQNEALGRSISFIIPPDLPDEMPKIIDIIKNGKHIKHYETQRIKKDGGLIHVSLTTSPIKDMEGNITGISTIARDITEKVEAEKKLKEYTRNLKIKNDELEQFAYVASHDLQEPLRMVASYVQLLQRRYEGKLDSDADDFIHFAADGASRMQVLINDLLSFSRISTRGKPFVETNVESVLQRALQNLQMQILESNAIIDHDPLPVVKADASQLVQVFQNLLSNSIKFCSKETPHILISAEQQDENWVFSVKDNGIGIDPEYFNRIYVIFQRLHTREEYPGTGIGLAICKRIVERHGGRIWVESEPGRGTTFFFTIPII
jgi:PAS domain S-box-containing protein